MRMKFVPYPMPHLHTSLLPVFFFVLWNYPGGSIFLLFLKSLSVRSCQVFFLGPLHQAATPSPAQHPFLQLATTPFHLQPLLVPSPCPPLVSSKPSTSTTKTGPSLLQRKQLQSIKFFLFYRKNKWLSSWEITKHKVSGSKLLSLSFQIKGDTGWKSENIQWEKWTVSDRSWAGKAWGHNLSLELNLCCRFHEFAHHTDLSV